MLAAWLDRSFRIVFISVLVSVHMCGSLQLPTASQFGPTAYYLDMSVLPFPMALPALLLYMIPYSDLCEQRGGRQHLYMVS